MADIELRGFTVLKTPPRGAVSVCGPYRPGTEDWMLYRAINDFRARGVGFVLVLERARENRGGFMGISLWRFASAPHQQPQAPAGEAPRASSTPAPSSGSLPSSRREEPAAKRAPQRT